MSELSMLFELQIVSVCEVGESNSMSRVHQIIRLVQPGCMAVGGGNSVWFGHQ